MYKLFKWLDNNFEICIGAVFLVLMVIFTSIQVIGRYVMSTPFPWTEEMTRYMFVWMVYIAVGYAVKENKHIRITFIRTLMPRKGKLILDIFSDLVFLLLASICTFVGFKLMRVIKLGGQTAVSLDFIPMWLLYLVMPLGFFILCLRLIQDIRIKYKMFGEKSPEEGEA